MVRNRSRHTFEERLIEHKAWLEQEAATLGPGPERDDLLRKADQIDTALHVNEWVNSPGLKPPR